MMNLLKIKNINIYFFIAILIAVILNFFITDTSDVQSAHEIDIAIKPCEVIGDSQIETSNFSQEIAGHICGQVLSEYMPLELEYFITNLDTKKEVSFCEYVKITTRSFVIEIPEGLMPGDYKFELKAGCRKHITETDFAILP